MSIICCVFYIGLTDKAWIRFVYGVATDSVVAGYSVKHSVERRIRLTMK